MRRAPPFSARHVAPSESTSCCVWRCPDVGDATRRASQITGACGQAQPRSRGRRSGGMKETAAEPSYNLLLFHAKRELRTGLSTTVMS